MSEFASPNGAPLWFSNCGSFQVHGLFGTNEDIVTRVYLQCARVDGEKRLEPTRIRMSVDVMEHYIRALSRTMPARLPADSTMSEIIGYVIDGLKDAGFARAVGFNGSKLYGATVEWSREIMPGTILFYLGDELVGECSGWMS